MRVWRCISFALALVVTHTVLADQSIVIKKAPAAKDVTMRIAESGDFPVGGVHIAICSPVFISGSHPDIRSTVDMYTDDPGHSIVASEAGMSWFLDVREIAPEKSHVELRVSESVPSGLIKDIWDAVKNCGK
jgi:hypothetical protein